MPVDDRERAVIDLWRKGHLRSATIQITPMGPPVPGVLRSGGPYS